MIKSMTGYGKAEIDIQGSTYSIEIRTLNSKQMDINIRIPSAFKSREIEIRNLLGQKLQRGKVDFNMSNLSQKQNNNLRLNQTIVKRYYAELSAMAKELGEEPDNLLSVISRLPDVFSAEEEEIGDEEWSLLKKAIEEATAKVNRFRTDEGSTLAAEFRQHIEEILTLLDQVPQYETARIDRIKTRIQKSLEENFSNVQYDKNRLEQEIIFYIEKLDITEEKIRLKKHCDYFLEVLQSEETVGKKLGFVLQEIGREINTLGSKANDATLQKLVVHMKDALEKIKEQMLNIL
jgi:uncharacterized protein (TIGR00255 family)